MMQFNNLDSKALRIDQKDRSKDRGETVYP